MARKQQAYPLPAEINPDGTIDVCVRVPADKGYLLAFVSQMERLSFWWSWQRDAMKTARFAAARMLVCVDDIRAQIDNHIACGGANVMIRQDPENVCILQSSEDGGETWIDIADLSLCVTAVRPNVTDQMIEVPEDYDPHDSFTNPTPSPEGTEEDKLCAASWNAAYILTQTQKGLHDQMNIDPGEIAMGLALATLLALWFAGFVIVLALIAAINAIFTLGGSLESAFSEFTGGQTRELACILRAHATLDPDGVVQFDSVAVQEDIAAISTWLFTSWLGMWVIVGVVGDTGLAKAGGLRIAPADLIECESCPDPFGCLVDFRKGQYGAYPYHYSVPALGIWEAGFGWHTQEWGGGNYGASIAVVCYVSGCNYVRWWVDNPVNSLAGVAVQLMQTDGTWLTVTTPGYANTGVNDGWTSWEIFPPTVLGLTGQVRLITHNNSYANPGGGIRAVEISPTNY